MGITKILSKYLENQQLVALYKNNDMESGYFGIITKIGDGEILIKRIDDAGNYDGYQILDLESIVCCCADSLYLKKVLKLMEQTEQGIPEIEELPGKDISNEILEYAFQTGAYLEIYIGSYRDSGKIADYSDENIVLYGIGPLGSEDGINYIRREYVECLILDSRDMREREKLNLHPVWPKHYVQKNFTELLQNIKEDGRLVEIWTVDDEESCHVGTIECSNDEEVLIKNINEEGEYDGYCVRKIEDIVRVVEHSGYLKKYEQAGEKEKCKIQMHYAGIMESILQSSRQNGRHLRVETAESYHLGKIENVTDDFVEMTKYEEYDYTCDGKIFIERSCIELVWIDTKELRRQECFCEAELS